MNDRFYTLLDQLALTDRIFSETDLNTLSTDYCFDWESIDHKIEKLREVGYEFLKQISKYT